MVELRNSTLSFSFPEVHTRAQCSLSFQRTVRIPDDGKNYPLPASVGTFPLVHVDDCCNAPAKWKAHGGIVLPMYQSEALWIKFSPGPGPNPYPFAVKISAGKVSAVTGERWAASLKEGDYIVIPKQPWLDGYVVSGGQIRQFVAAPLGAGYTVEEQVTGEAEFGGIQIQVYPMRREAYDKRFPPRKDRILRNRGFTKCSESHSKGVTIGDSSDDFLELSSMDYCCEISDGPVAVAGVAAPACADMGMAAGGSMVQEVYADPYSFTDWDREHTDRCYVHLANSLVWRELTGKEPPTAPLTSNLYKRLGIPWFDYYDSDGIAKEGTSVLAGVKSVAQMDAGKQGGLLPENSSVTPSKPVTCKDKRPGVRDGAW